MSEDSKRIAPIRQTMPTVPPSVYCPAVEKIVVDCGRACVGERCLKLAHRALLERAEVAAPALPPLDGRLNEAQSKRFVDLVVSSSETMIERVKIRCMLCGRNTTGGGRRAIHWLLCWKKPPPGKVPIR